MLTCLSAQLIARFLNVSIVPMVFAAIVAVEIDEVLT